MKKIIPFKKELEFETNISEITSISLEHSLDLIDDTLVSGTFTISGTYKITDIASSIEPFEFILPFDIALSSRYDTSDLKIDIDDFYYEIVNNNLKVNIDVYIDGEIKEEEFDIIEEPSLIIEEEEEQMPEEQIKEAVEVSERCIDEEEKEDLEKSIIYKEPLAEEMNSETETKIDFSSEGFNIFDNIDERETYTAYKVYIVKENDTLDKIMTKYKVTKEELENYNNISEIKQGDKIIIPSLNE